jgi:IS30 family transposase
MASHLTLEEREVIAHLQRTGKMQAQIADRLGRSKRTISRELRRNRSRNGYWAVAAQRKAERRRSERP